MPFNSDVPERNRQRRRLRSRSDDIDNNTRAATRTTRGNGSEGIPWVSQFQAELNRLNAWLTARAALNARDDSAWEDAAAGPDGEEDPTGGHTNQEDPNDVGNPDRPEGSQRPRRPDYSRYSRRLNGPGASEQERHNQYQQNTQPVEASQRPEMQMSALERAAGGDFDAAFADYEAQERRHAQERAQIAQRRSLAQQSADENDPSFVITEPFDFDAFMKKACGEEDDESEQPAAGDVQADTGVEMSKHSSNIPDVATGTHDPNSPFAVAGVPLQWGFSCIHRDTVSNSNPTGDSLWPNPGGAFNPQDYPIPDIPRSAPNALSSVPAGGNSGGTGNPPTGVPSRNANTLPSAFSTTPAPTDHEFAQTERNHPDAFPAAPTSRGILAAVNPFTDSGRGRDNQRGPSSRRSSRGFDKLDDILLSGSGPLKQGTPFQIPPGGGLVQPGYQFTTRGLNNPIPSYPSIGRNLPLTASRLTNNPLINPSPSSSAPLGANPGQTSHQATGSGSNNPDPKAPSTPAAQQVNRRKRRLIAEELARRVKPSLE